MGPTEITRINTIIRGYITRKTNEPYTGMLKMAEKLAQTEGIPAPFRLFFGSLSRPEANKLKNSALSYLRQSVLNLDLSRE